MFMTVTRFATREPSNDGRMIDGSNERGNVSLNTFVRWHKYITVFKAFF